MTALTVEAASFLGRRGGFARAQSGPGGDELAGQIGAVLLAQKIRPPARNSPCGCGSGRKAKYCCWGPDTNHKET